MYFFLFTDETTLYFWWKNLQSCYLVGLSSHQATVSIWQTRNTRELKLLNCVIFFFLTKSSRTLYIYSLRFAFSNSFQCCNPSPKLIRRAPSLQYDVRLSFRSLWELLREARWPVTVGKSSLMIYWPWLRNQDSVTRAGPRSIPELDGVVFISRVTVPTLWIRIRGMKSLESNGSCFFFIEGWAVTMPVGCDDLL